jgi:hypothetical protein
MNEATAWLTIRYERERPLPASATYLAYGVSRRVELPVGVESLPLEEQLRVIEGTIADRNADYVPHISTSPFGEIVGYGYHRPQMGVLELDRAGKPLRRSTEED